MSSDRIITFPKGPTKKQVESVTRNFFGEAAEVAWDQDTLTVKLQGPGTFPYEGIEPDYMPTMRPKERWITVEGHGEQIDVITRLGDDYTSACADGLVEVFARYWEGTLDDDEEDEDED